MKTIYLVRHGESDINVSDTYLDDLSPPLTRLGIQQSQYLAERAKRLTFETLIASPFERTKRTAEMIAEKTGHTIEFNGLFGERTLPAALVGISKSDPDAKALADAAFRSSENGEQKVEGTETFFEMKARAKEALTFLEGRPEKSMLVVGHGYFTRVLIAYMWYGDALTPKEFAPLVWGMRTRNTGISVLRFDPTDTHRPWWLLVWNDHAHLG